MLVTPVLDLQKYLDQGVRVKLQGGREVHGVLKGFDPLVNVVLDECIEFIRGKRKMAPSPFCAGLVCNQFPAGRLWSISMSHVGVDEIDPRRNPTSNPLGGGGWVGGGVLVVV